MMLALCGNKQKNCRNKETEIRHLGADAEIEREAGEERLEVLLAGGLDVPGGHHELWLGDEQRQEDVQVTPCPLGGAVTGRGSAV